MDQHILIGNSGLIFKLMDVLPVHMVQVVCSFSVYAYLVWRITSLVLFLALAWGLPSALFLLGVAKVSHAPPQPPRLVYQTSAYAKHPSFSWARRRG